MLCTAIRGTVRLSGSGCETAREPPPSDALFVQQVAHVPARHHHQACTRWGAVIDGEGVGDQSSLHHELGGVAHVSDHCHAVRLAGDQVDMTGGRLPKDGLVKVVAHCKVLSIVPQCRHGVAIVVTHDYVLAEPKLTEGHGPAGKLDELVHQPTVKSLLLGSVPMVLRANELPRTIKAKGLKR